MGCGLGHFRWKGGDGGWVDRVFDAVDAVGRWVRV